MSDRRTVLRVVVFAVVACAVVSAPVVGQSGLYDDTERGTDNSDVGSDGSFDGGGNDDDDVGYPGSDYDPGGSGEITDPDGGYEDDDDDSGPTDGWVEPEIPLSERGADNQLPEEGNASNRSGGGLLGLGPGAWMKQAIADVSEGFASGVETFVNGVQATIFGIPTVGDAGDPGTWDDVGGPFWPAVQDTYRIVQVLALFGLGLIAMRIHGSASGRELKKRYADVLVSLLMILLGWYVTQGALHLGDALSMGFAPDAETIFETPGNTAKVGLGLVVGAAALFINSGAVLTAFAVVLLERAVLLIMVALWPIFWMFRPTGGGLSNTVAGLGLGTFTGVLGAKVFQAILAFMVFSISWSNLHAVEAVGAIIGTVIGVVVTFIGVPLMVGRNFIPEAMTVLGTPAVSVATNFSEQATSVARERGREAVHHYGESARGRAEGAISEARRLPERVPSVTEIRQSGGSPGGSKPDVVIKERARNPVAQERSARDLNSHLRERDSARDDRLQN